MESGVAKVLLTLLQRATNALLLGDVAIKFFDVTFGLLGARPLGLFRLCSRGFNVINVTAVSEINEGDDWGRGDDGIQTDLVNQLNEDAGSSRARDVRDGGRKIMFVPSGPDSGVGLTGGVERGEAGTNDVLRERHDGECGDEGAGRSVVGQVGESSERELQRRDGEKSRNGGHRRVEEKRIEPDHHPFFSEA